MSWWCEKCQMLNYGKDKCVGCGYIKEESSKGYRVPSNKGARIKNFNTFENEKKTALNKNTVIITAVIIIAISMSYLAISKYRENKANEEAFRYITGSNNQDEYLNATPQEKMKMMNKSKMMKDTEIILEDGAKKQIEVFNNFLEKNN